MAISYKIFLTLIFLVSFIGSTKPQAGDALKFSNYSIKKSVTTSADKAIIWNLWMDVNNWKEFDERLEYSYIIDNKKLEKGALGYLKAKNGPKTKFEITEFKEHISFTEVLKLPLYQTIELKRYFNKSDNNDTVFTHEVIFRGRLRFATCALLCGAFKKDIQLVLQQMKILAEENMAQEDSST